MGYLTPNLPPSAYSRDAEVPQALFGAGILDEVAIPVANLAPNSPEIVTHKTPLPKIDRINLPIDPYLAEIAQSVRDNHVTIIQAETGAGKSVRVPQYLADAGMRVVVTEPRIIAAKSLSARVAAEMGEELGGKVGFRTALYREDSSHTDLLYCTDGLELVRQLTGSEGHRDVLIIDEIHEWNRNMETLLAWVNSKMAENPNLRLLIMSATIELGKLEEFLGGANTIKVPGRTFGVTERRPNNSIEEDVADLVSEGRNVLVFQPGKREIEECVAQLACRGLDAEILPLHGQLSLADQERAFRQYDRPKVVIATNVAQTSITIPDIDAVVDSGLERRIETRNGIEGLYPTVISLADREQRKGRAGRTKPGIYIDHCDVEIDKRPKFPTPEMLRVRPDQCILRLLDAGVDISEIKFFHAPPQHAIDAARKTLRFLGCVDNDGAITEIGREVAKLPVSVEGAKMLLEASSRGVLREVMKAVCILESGSIVDFEQFGWQRFSRGETESDLLALVDVYDAVLALWQRQGSSSHALSRICESYGIKQATFSRARENHLLQMKYFGFDCEQAVPSTRDRADILKSIAAGLVEHVYEQCSEDPNLYFNGTGPRQLSRDSVVGNPNWLVGVPFDLGIETSNGTKVLNLVTRATTIRPDWLYELAPHLLTQDEISDPRYSIKNDEVYFAATTHYLGHLIKREFYTDPTDPRTVVAFADWLCEMMESERVQRKVTRSEELAKVISYNQNYLERAAKANRKAGSEVMLNYKGEKMREFFLEKLGGRSRLTDIEDLTILRFG